MDAGLVLRPKVTAGLARRGRIAIAAAAPVIAALLARTAIGIYRFPSVGTFVVGFSIGLALVITGLFTYRELYEHFFAIRIEESNVGITNWFGRTRRFAAHGLRGTFLSWTAAYPIGGSTAPIAYAFLLRPDGRVVAGLDSGFFEESSVKGFLHRAGIQVSGGWASAPAQMQEQAMSMFPGVQRWWNARAALAIPAVLVMVVPGILTLVLKQHS